MKTMLTILHIPPIALAVALSRKISQSIRSFMGFGLVTLLGFGGVWACWQLRISLYITIWLLFAVGLIVLVGLLGMIWSLIEWIISGLVSRRGKHPHHT